MQSFGAAFANVTVSGNHTYLASNHDISGTLDAIDQTLSAPVQVVEFGLGDTVVDVDSWAQKAVVFILQHPVKVVHSCGRFFRDTVASLKYFWVLAMDQGSKITAIVEDEIQLLAIGERGQGLLDAPVVFLFGFTFPCETV